MAPHRRRAIWFAAIAAVAVIAVAIGISQRGGGGKRTAANRPAATDPWAAPTGPAAPRAPNAFDRLVRARPAGPPVTVTGTVRLAGAGTPVAGAEVAFMNETGENTATADDSGRYSIQVASGIRWKVHARTDTTVGYPEAFTPSATDTARDLEVQPTATVTGAVVDARGAAVPGAVISVEVDAADRGLLEGALPMSTTADDAGRFELATVPGTFKVKAARDHAQGAAAVVALAPGGRLAVEIRLRDPLTLSGRVVDGEGRPLPDAKVLVAATIAEGGPTEKLQLTSGADGSFAGTSPAGWVRIEARKGSDLSPATAAWYESGTRLDNLVLTVAPPVALRGKVVTSEGLPIVGARVRLVAHAVYDSATGSDGSFEVAAPGDQAYLVKIKHSDGQLERQLTGWDGEQTFVMRRFGSLRITAAGTGELTAAIDGFAPVGETAARLPAVTRFRGNGGVVELTDLEPGTYDLTVATDGAGATRVPRVVIEEGAARTLTVELTAPVTVRGVVRSGAQPVAGAQVVIGARAAFTDARGRWSIDGVAAGPIALTATKHGLGDARVGATAAVDGAPIEIELRASGPQVEGVGLVLGPAAEGAIVTTVLPGSPAEGKLAPGDVIAAVDGADVARAAMDDIVGRLRGAAGSSVKITIRRGADKTTVDVVRRRVAAPPGQPVVATRSVRREARC